MYVFKLRLLVLPFAFGFRTSLAAELASQPVLPDDCVDGPAADAEQLGNVGIPKLRLVQDCVDDFLIEPLADLSICSCHWSWFPYQWGRNWQFKLTSDGEDSHLAGIERKEPGQQVPRLAFSGVSSMALNDRSIRAILKPTENSVRIKAGAHVLL
jgi:hypothetical protein